MFSTKVAGILALIASLVVIGLIALQVLELNYYNEPTSVAKTAAQ
jgi:hypothetical protein